MILVEHATWAHMGEGGYMRDWRTSHTHKHTHTHTHDLPNGFDAKVM